MWACIRQSSSVEILVFYESRKRELKTKPIYECRCDERLKTKTEKSARLAYTGLHGELEHLKIKTRLIEVPNPAKWIFLLNVVSLAFQKPTPLFTLYEPHTADSGDADSV
jgi:hypothetical protein